MPSSLWPAAPLPSPFSPSPSEAPLAEDEIHVWCVSLEQPLARLAAFEGLLSPDERARAARLAFPHLRDRFIAGRGALRTLLASYVAAPPAALAFRYGPHGKPALSDPWRSTGVEFNLAHSDRLALIAVARERVLGVDIERHRSMPDYRRIAERYFAPDERAALAALAPDAQPAAFFACWTRKEAFLKAQGRGLSLPLDAFTVTVHPDEPARLLRVREDAGGSAEVARWRLVSLDPVPGYAAALAAAGHEWRLTCRQWRDEAPTI